MLNHAVKFAFGLYSSHQSDMYKIWIDYLLCPYRTYSKGPSGISLNAQKKKTVRAQKKGQHWTLAVHAQDVTIKQTFVT